MTRSVRFRHEVAARARDAGSAIGTAVPVLGELIGGKRTSAHLAARWRFSGLGVGNITSWQTFMGNRHSGRTPRGYVDVACITVEKSVLDALRAEHEGSSQAVVYALGSAVMVGTVPDRPEFLGTDNRYDERYAVGMRVGKGVLRAAIGVRTDKGVTYVPAQDMGSHGLAVPVHEWPADIPVL